MEYPEPWADRQEEATGLIAFLFAIISHDIADVFWHGLGGFQDSFIHAMAAQNFHGSYSKAHLAADTGAEFTLRHSAELKYFNATWTVPVRDLANIYSQMYKHTDISTPSEEDLRYCMQVGYTAFKADLRLGKYLFPYYGQQSPFLIENLNHYYRGGIQDMTARVVSCWREVAGNFNGSFYSGTLCSSHWDNARRVSTNVHSAPSSSDHNEKVRILQSSGYRVLEDWNDAKGTLSLSLATIPYENERQQHVFENINLSFDITNILDTCEIYGSDIMLTSNQSSGGLAYDIVLGDFNHDQYPDVAVSAPYHSVRELHSGVVIVVDGRKESYQLDNNDIFLASNNHLQNDIPNSRFGWSMVVLDFNNDGVDDLAVASPFGGAGDGFVSVYYGKAGIGLSSKPDVTLYIPHRKNNYGFGSRLYAIDVNGDGQKDLVVGCPHCGQGQSLQTGALYIFYSKISHPPSLTVPDMTLRSPIIQRYEHFGRAVSLISNGSHRLLVVGAFGYSLKEAQRVGRVYAFDMKNFRSPHLQWTMIGDIEFQQFGSDIVADEQRLVIASKSETSSKFGRNKKWQTGNVRVYDATALLRQHGNIGTGTHLITSAFGKEVAAHFGHSLALDNNILWVGEPLAAQGLYKETVLDMLKFIQSAQHLLTEQGRIYQWDLDSNQLACLFSNDPRVSVNMLGIYGIFHTHYFSKQARFGHRIAVNSDASSGKIEKVISSEYYSAESRYVCSSICTIECSVLITIVYSKVLLAQFISNGRHECHLLAYR
ncbi:hypothetical protein BGW37DRAFT_60321 [Umbelopsis sp. PMI_123]|nr:hypothetical protein BGW37DRAFT_60321 [Umbelopsis sp. PMI_123]